MQKYMMCLFLSLFSIVFTGSSVAKAELSKSEQFIANYKETIVDKILEGSRGEHLAVLLPKAWEWSEWKILSVAFGAGMWDVVKYRAQVASQIAGTELFQEKFLKQYRSILLSKFSETELLLLERIYGSQSHKYALEMRVAGDGDIRKAFVVRDKERKEVTNLVLAVTHQVRSERGFERIVNDAVQGKLAASTVRHQSVSMCTIL